MYAPATHTDAGAGLPRTRHSKRCGRRHAEPNARDHQCKQQNPTAQELRRLAKASAAAAIGPPARSAARVLVTDDWMASLSVGELRNIPRTQRTQMPTSDIIMSPKRKSCRGLAHSNLKRSGSESSESLSDRGWIAPICDDVQNQIYTRRFPKGGASRHWLWLRSSLPSGTLVVVGIPSCEFKCHTNSYMKWEDKVGKPMNA